MRIRQIGSVCVVLFLVSTATAVLCGEAMAPDPKQVDVDTPAKAVPNWQGELAKKLTRKVSFEFVDTPVQEAFTFMQTLANANFILDPKAVEKGLAQKAISLRVQDMDMKTALDWICRLSGLSCEQRDQAVFITVAEERIETDEGLSVFRLHKGLPEGLTPEKLKELSAVAAPKARVAYDPDLKLLIVACEDAKELRRAEALLRVLGVDTKDRQQKATAPAPAPDPKVDVPAVEEEKAGKEF